MGVVSLWQLLEPVRQTRSLPELKGQKIAIDLSAWIVGSKKVPVSSGYRNVYLRTIFLRTLDLLKCGILPVFVCDGCIPKIKFDKVRTRWKGRSFGKSGPIFRDRSQSDTTQICFHLFECLGLPCLKSEGEGEALCAFLNKEQIVDGCLTSDSDVLLYGAQKVYRNYKKKNKVGYLECYDANDVHIQLKLDQRSLVSLALLLGCDYNQLGVPGVGVKTAIRMIREMQRKNIDSLQRMLSWRTNQQLQELQEKMDLFNIVKHCEECLHIVASHSQSRCELCGDNINVSEDLEQCECSCHSFLETYVSQEEEFKVWQKAMLLPNFPSEEVIEEFLIPTESVDLKADVNWHEPNLADLQSFVSQHLHWNGHVLFKTLVPLFIQWKLNSSSFSCLDGMEPLRITKKQRKNYQLVYEVEWSKMNEDIWTKDATYLCTVDRELFHKRFPEMVKVFEDSLLPAVNMNRSKITPISTVSHRMTRGTLKKEVLTLFDMEDGNQGISNDNNESRSGQFGISPRKSKRLIEKNTGKHFTHVPTRITRSSTRSSNSADLKPSTESFDDWIDSIPKSFAGIKKRKNVNTKMKSDVEESRRNVSAEMSSCKYSNLIGVCTVTLERIPSVGALKAAVRGISVNEEDGSLGTKISLEDSLEVMDCLEDSKESASKMKEKENSLDCQNVKTETSKTHENSNRVDSIEEGFDEKLKDSKRKDAIMESPGDVDSIVEGSNSEDIMMDCSFGGVSLVEGTNSKDVVMEGLNGMNSIVEGSYKDMIKEGSNDLDSIMEDSNSKDVMMECSNGINSSVEGSNNKDKVMEDSNDMSSLVEGTNSKDVINNSSTDTDSIMGGSNSKEMNSLKDMNPIVEGKNSIDVVKNISNVIDSFVEGSNNKDVLMEGSNDMDSIMERSESEDVIKNNSNVINSIVEDANNNAVMDSSNTLDSIMEGASSKNVMMNGSNGIDSIVKSINGMDSIMDGSKCKDMMKNISNGMHSTVEYPNSKDVWMEGSNGLVSVKEGANNKDVVKESSNSIDFIVEGSNSKGMMKKTSNCMDSIVDVTNSKDVRMEGSNDMESIVAGTNSEDVMQNSSNDIDAIVESSTSKDLVMEDSDSKDMKKKSSKDVDSIADVTNCKNIMMEGSNGLDSIMEVSNSDDMNRSSNVMNSIVEDSNSNAVITECLNKLDSIMEDLNSKDVMLQGSNDTDNMVVSSTTMHDMK